tara:strand:+ start:479 stop:898 length:420 start_codon:yes stop_codon:yes gene_type:complete
MTYYSQQAQHLPSNRLLTIIGTTPKEVNSALECYREGELDLKDELIVPDPLFLLYRDRTKDTDFETIPIIDNVFLILGMAYSAHHLSEQICSGFIDKKKGDLYELNTPVTLTYLLPETIIGGLVKCTQLGSIISKYVSN